MNKQIEEIAKHFCLTCEMERDGRCLDGKNPCKCYFSLAAAEALYNAGYRKQEDVAREIFTQLEEEIKSAIAVNYKAREARMNRGYSEIDDNMMSSIWAKINTLRGILDFIEELKKKYGVTEE